MESNPLDPRRYVVLEHLPEPGTDQRLHWDWLFESGGELLTWSSFRAPHPDLRCIAESKERHRIEYLEYEGPVSNSRGMVVRRCSGLFVVISDCETEFTAELTGDLIGRIELTGDESGWHLYFSGAVDRNVPGQAGFTD